MNKFNKSLSNTQTFLEIISDKNRLVILKYLTGGEKCVCEIWKGVRLSQNLTSHHLKVLKDFKLISSRKDGLKVIYKINQEKIQSHINLLNKYLINNGDKNEK